MSNISLDAYIQNIKSDAPTISASMDETSLVLTLNSLFDLDIKNLEETTDLALHSVFFYDIPEGKKHFNIETVRKCICDTELKPYSGKHIFVLRHFDTANIEAMNAMLKLLEDTPKYAVILLEIENVTSLLETIRSRSLHFGTAEKHSCLDDTTKALLDDFSPESPSKWLFHLYGAKYTKQEAIEILQRVYSKYHPEKQKFGQEMIRALFGTNESPRNILDAFFLGNTL
ncbi:hypothetical protein CSB09_03400 [Candidatus Gracilibacteria bacterium]|nr:MAG: hypothetical protein CSB09_03400 [Candidatus Gracilibacteria bacterium]